MVGMHGTGKPSHLPRSALGLNLSFDPTASLTLNELDRGGKGSNWITTVDRKFTQKGERDLKAARCRGRGSTCG